MSVRDDILSEAEPKYPDTSCEWRSGYVRGVRDALEYLGLNGWGDPELIIETMDGHRIEYDSIPRCRCGRGFATLRDLKLHIAEEIATCGYEGAAE